MEITPLEVWISQRLGAGGKPFRREQIEACQLQKLRQTIRWSGCIVLFTGNVWRI